MTKKRTEQRQHYIPAAYIGRFSWDMTKRSRKRPLYVADKSVDDVFRSTAEEIGYRVGLYNISGAEDWLGEHIDVWDYETRLPAALSALVDATEGIDADVWLHTLVPFVAGLFVRSPDRNDGVNNVGRVIEFQELLAPIMAARWTVVHLAPGAELISSDRGFGGVTLDGQMAIMVPCDRQTALVLSYCDKRSVAVWSEDRWIAPISHRHVEASVSELFRQSVCKSAYTSVYGAGKDLVAQFRGDLSTIAEYPAGIVTANDCDLMGHTYDYFRLCSAISGSPTKAEDLANKISWDAFPGKWDIPIAVELLFPERTRGGVLVDDSEILLNLQYGISLMRIRRELHDFRRGAISVFPIRYLPQQLVALGEHWQTGARGPNGNTFMRIRGTGREVEINLGLLRSDLGLN
jgi:hypothetical protein